MKNLRKGMIMLAVTSRPPAVIRFQASILILYHNTTINTKYQAMLHVSSIRQTVRIVEILDKTVLRTGDRDSFLFYYSCIRLKCMVRRYGCHGILVQARSCQSWPECVHLPLEMLSRRSEMATSRDLIPRGQNQRPRRHYPDTGGTQDARSAVIISVCLGRTSPSAGCV